MPSGCPESGTPGRPVPPETLRALVPELPAGGAERPWHYCGAPDCEVVYFDALGAVIRKSALAVRIGAKERDPPHTLCYCFGHTAEDVREDLARYGRPTIPDSIQARVWAGECRCEVRNPTGSCCLGDVAREVRRAAEEAAAPLAPATAGGNESPAGRAGEAPDCCAPAGHAQAGRTGTGTDRRAFAALAASGLTAMGASACCWLPLLLVAVGASSAGVAATFEELRPFLLGAAPVLIGIAFYLIYVRRTPCAKGSACEVRRGSPGRAVRAFFWVAVALLGFSIAFPTALATLLGGSAPAQPERLAGLPSLELRISGMTCASCAAGVRHALLEVEGVVDAAAEHEQGVARVWYEPARPPPEAALRAALSRRGYAVHDAPGPAAAEAPAGRVVHLRAAGMVKSLGIT